MMRQQQQRSCWLAVVVVVTVASLLVTAFTHLKCAPPRTSRVVLKVESNRLQQLESSPAPPVGVEAPTVTCSCKPCQPPSCAGAAPNQGVTSAAAVAQSAQQVWGYESPITDVHTMQKYAKAYEVLPNYTFPAAGADMVSFWQRLAPFFHEHVHTDNNGMFDECDAAVLHAFLRHSSPRRVFEVGSGFSTRVASKALALNAAAGGNKAKHLCVEPYRAAVVRSQGVDVDIVERPIQEVDLSLFSQLERGDVLFLDNSHVVKPYGDVIYEYLFILPRLKPGVYVHIHDILLPYDYIPRWMEGDLRQYTEQYMLAAFLYGNKHWKVVFHNGHFNNTAGHLLSVMDEASKQQYLSRCSFDHVAQPTVAMPASIYLQRL